MRITYCDRCAARDLGRGSGCRVARVTMEPMARTLDLCGACRSDLQPFLDDFLGSELGALARLRDRIAALEIGRDRRKLQIRKLNATINNLRRGLFS